MIHSSKLAPLEPIGFENRARRAMWYLAWALLYRPTPISAHGFRRAILRAFGATVESRSYPYPSARIWAPWNLTMRRGSCLANNVDCYNVEYITLGEGVTVSQKSYLCTASHNFDSPSFDLIGGPITIEEGAWIAASSFVGPGVRVGANAVVLACAVVVNDVPQGTVVGGNPARTIRDRKL